MKVVCYASSAKHQIAAIEGFISGLKRHGITDVSFQHSQDLPPCDLAVFWGHRQHGIISKQRRAGNHYLVMERGYIGDRFLWTSLGFDGLNGRAKFPKIDDGMKRWNQHFAQYLKPWKETAGKTAIIMGQVRGDESVRAIDFEQWIIDIDKSLRQLNFVVWFRPHPGEPCYRPKDIRVLPGPLDQALYMASLAVTYNSNSGVDAVLAGVPVHAADPGSMVYDLSCRIAIPWRPPREYWCAKMAYTQWLPEEIESGAAWDALGTVHLG